MKKITDEVMSLMFDVLDSILVKEFGEYNERDCWEMIYCFENQYKIHKVPKTGTLVLEIV